MSPVGNEGPSDDSETVDASFPCVESTEHTDNGPGLSSDKACVKKTDDDIKVESPCATGDPK